MRKALLLMSSLSLIIVTIGTAILPNYPLFQLASNSNFYQYVRATLTLVLLLQLVTRPPRHLFFRILAGLTSILIVSWVVINTYNGIMPFLDTLSLLSAAVAIGITTLEINTTDAKENRPGKSTSPLIA
jgi:CDP-diglyceride synthetase